MNSMEEGYIEILKSGNAEVVTHHRTKHTAGCWSGSQHPISDPTEIHLRISAQP